jgi:hypothetical protein
MSKKHFIALADNIRAHNKVAAHNTGFTAFTPDQLETLADFCRSQNYNFKGERWIAYLRGECGPNGGKL